MALLAASASGIGVPTSVVMVVTTVAVGAVVALAGNVGVASVVAVSVGAAVAVSVATTAATSGVTVAAGVVVSGFALLQAANKQTGKMRQPKIRTNFAFMKFSVMIYLLICSSVYR